MRKVVNINLLYNHENMLNFISFCVNLVKRCYCEYENGGKFRGSERGIMCSTTGQWVREYHCKAANYAEGSFGEFCTGPHNKSEAVKWETKDELCSPGTANILIANGL